MRELVLSSLTLTLATFHRKTLASAVEPTVTTCLSSNHDEAEMCSSAQWPDDPDERIRPLKLSDEVRIMRVGLPLTAKALELGDQETVEVTRLALPAPTPVTLIAVEVEGERIFTEGVWSECTSSQSREGSSPLVSKTAMRPSVDVAARYSPPGENDDDIEGEFCRAEDDSFSRKTPESMQDEEEEALMTRRPGKVGPVIERWYAGVDEADGWKDKLLIEDGRRLPLKDSR